jgi:hypothetical protein
MNVDKVGEVCGHDTRNAYKILVRNLEETRPFRTVKCRRDNNFEMLKSDLSIQFIRPWGGYSGVLL